MPLKVAGYLPFEVLKFSYIFTTMLHHVIIYCIYILFNFTGKEYLMD